MAKIALVESKPSRNDYVRLFNNEIQFDQFQLCSDPTVKKVLFLNTGQTSSVIALLYKWG